MNAHAYAPSDAIEADVLLARGGDHAAFHRLVEYSGNAVCSIALAITRNVAASEDIAQEAYLAAWTGLGNLRNPASFLPWMRQLARNQAHYWRRSQREVADEPALSVAADARPRPDDALVRAETERVLEEVLEQLPDEAREVLVLYYREASSTRQVSLLLGISEDAVRQRISRARALVRQEMLARFGGRVAATAPGVAFFASVAGAMTFAAPSASAAIGLTSASAGSTTGSLTAATMAKASVTAGAFSWAGVLLGMRYLEPVFDEQERRELRRFRNGVLAIVTLGCPIVAMSTTSPMALLISIQSLYLILGALYGVVLPRILRRRSAWEQSVDPQLAAQNRRRRLWATAGRAAGAAIGGTMIMGVVTMLMH